MSSSPVLELTMLCTDDCQILIGRFEDKLIDNLVRHSKKGIILSWSNNKGGNGHVNIKANTQVDSLMRMVRFKRDDTATRFLRSSVTDIHWFRDSLIVYKRLDAETK